MVALAFLFQPVYIITTTRKANIAPKMRSNRFQTPPPEKYNDGTRTSGKRLRFYDAQNQRAPGRSLRSLEREFHKARSGQINQTNMDAMPIIGLASYRISLAGLQKSPNKLAKCQFHCLKTRSASRLQEAQIGFHKIPAKRRAVQRRLKICTNRGGRYKMALPLLNLLIYLKSIEGCWNICKLVVESCGKPVNNCSNIRRKWSFLMFQLVLGYEI